MSLEYCTQKFIKILTDYS